MLNIAGSYRYPHHDVSRSKVGAGHRHRRRPHPNRSFVDEKGRWNWWSVLIDYAQVTSWAKIYRGGAVDTEAGGKQQSIPTTNVTSIVLCRCEIAGLLRSSLRTRPHVGNGMNCPIKSTYKGSLFLS